MRRHDPFDRRAATVSVAVHLVALGVAWASTLHRPPELEFVAYEIELVSPPPAVQAEEARPATEEMVVEQPDPRPPEPEPEPEEQEVPVEEERPPEPPAPEPEPVKELAEEEPTPATTSEEPPEEATESGEDLRVRIEGIKRDYPAYYAHIIRQITNCFRPPRGGAWEATVVFFIERDGSVREMRLERRSGNPAFDFAALGAVECAGRGRLDPLPDDLPLDRLPVLFDFRPNRDVIMRGFGDVPTPTPPAQET